MVVADTCTLMQANPAPKTVPATEAFAELSFFCVDTARQVEGLGTRLMHRLKAELVRMGLPKILVYADSGAISFFQAQGFTHHVTVGEADLEGRIAHYVDSALMECALVEGLPYTRLPLLVRRARTRMLNKWATGEVADKSGDVECGLCDDVFADEVDEYPATQQARAPPPSASSSAHARARRCKPQSRNSGVSGASSLTLHALQPTSVHQGAAGGRLRARRQRTPACRAIRLHRSQLARWPRSLTRRPSTPPTMTQWTP